MQTSTESDLAVEPLDDRRVDLWYVRTEMAANSETVNAFRQLLSPEELQREQRYRFERDRVQCVVARALARLALGQYLQSDPSALEFFANPFGKPFLSGPAAPLEFNLSHTPGLVVCLVARGREVGVDAEDVSREVEHLPLARRFFARTESAALASLPQDHLGSGFFRFWTLKEAYVKACGLGLAIPLSDFGFVLEEGRRPRITFTERAGDDPARWQFAELRIDGRYQVALAVRDASGEPIAATVREVTGPGQIGAGRLLTLNDEHPWAV